MSGLTIDEITELIGRQIFPVCTELYRLRDVKPTKDKSVHILTFEECDRGGKAIGKSHQAELTLPRYDLTFEGGELFLLNRLDQCTSYHYTMEGFILRGANGFSGAIPEIKKGIIAYAMLLDNRFCGKKHNIGELFEDYF